MTRPRLAIAVVVLSLASCAVRIPTVTETNDAVLLLREQEAWAWALGIGLIWADVFLPVPQSTVIAALGIVYGTWVGGLLGAVGLITGGLIGYGLMRTGARHLVVRMTGPESMRKMEAVFDRAGTWAIVLTRSLPYSVPEVLVFLAGLAGMGLARFVLALTLGSVPVAFLYAGIGAEWSEQPLLVLAVSYVLPLVSLPPALYLLRARPS